MGTPISPQNSDSQWKTLIIGVLLISWIIRLFTNMIYYVHYGGHKMGINTIPNGQGKQIHNNFDYIKYLLTNYYLNQKIGNEVVL